MPASADFGGITVTNPEVHPDARLRFSFHRTLRVPDDDSTYDLPPSLGNFPIRATENSTYALPMWQAEACWIDFSGGYPYLVTIGAGSINAVTGGEWSPTPDFDAADYFETPDQPWLDGFNVGTGEVRQFLAAPLGRGHTVEEQLFDGPATGGINVAAYPLKASAWNAKPEPRSEFDVDFCFPANLCASPPPIGLAGGGSIRQSIKAPVRSHDDWDLDQGVRFHIEITNSDAWQQLTGEQPPSHPPTAAEYSRHGLPWFSWYDEAGARDGSDRLKGTSALGDFGPLPGNDSFEKPEPHVVGP